MDQLHENEGESGPVIDENTEEYGDAIEAMKAHVREKFDGQLPNGIKCSIYRHDPHWCRGYQETVPADDTFSIENIKERNGGGRYQLRYLDQGGRYVTSRRITIDGPPKREGLRLDDPETAARKARDNERLEKQADISNKIAAGPDPTEMLKGMMQILGENRSGGMEILAPMMAFMQTQSQAQTLQMQTSFDQNLRMMRELMEVKNSVPQTNPAADMMQYFQLFNQLKGKDIDSENSEFSTILNKAFDVLGNKQTQQNDSPPYIGSEFFGNTPPTFAAPGRPSPNPGPEYEEYEDEDEDEDEEIDTGAVPAIGVDNLDEDQLVAHVCNLFQSADNQKRQILMQKFIESATIDDLGTFQGANSVDKDTDS